MYEELDLDFKNELSAIESHLYEELEQMREDAVATTLVEPNSLTLHKSDNSMSSIRFLRGLGMVSRENASFPLDLIDELKQNPVNKVIFNNAGFIGKNGQNYDHLVTYRWNPAQETKISFVTRLCKEIGFDNLPMKSYSKEPENGDRGEISDIIQWISDTSCIVLPEYRYFDVDKVSRPLAERIEEILDIGTWKINCFRIEGGAMVNLGLSNLTKQNNFNLSSKSGKNDCMVIKRDKLNGLKFPCIIVGKKDAKTYKSIHDKSRGANLPVFWILFENSEANIKQFEKVLSKKVTKGVKKSNGEEVSLEIEKNLMWIEPIHCLNGVQSRNGSFTKNTELNKVKPQESGVYLGKASTGSWEGKSPEENPSLVRFMASVIYANEKLSLVRDSQLQKKQFREFQIEFWQFFYAIYPEAYYEKMMTVAKKAEKEISLAKTMPAPQIHEEKAQSLILELKDMRRKQDRREKYFKNEEKRDDIIKTINEALFDAKEEYLAKYPVFEGRNVEDNSSLYETGHDGRPLIKPSYEELEAFDYPNYFFGLEEEVAMSLDGMGIGLSPSDSMAFREIWNYENEEAEKRETFLFHWIRGELKGEAEEDFFSSSPSSPRVKKARVVYNIRGKDELPFNVPIAQVRDSQMERATDFFTPEKELKEIRYDFQDTNKKRKVVIFTKAEATNPQIDFGTPLRREKLLRVRHIKVKGAKKHLSFGSAHNDNYGNFKCYLEFQG